MTISNAKKPRKAIVERYTLYFKGNKWYFNTYTKINFHLDFLKVVYIKYIFYFIWKIRRYQIDNSTLVSINTHKYDFVVHVGKNLEG